MSQHLHNQRGFTLLEVLLSLVVVGILGGVTLELMGSHMEAYSFITNRQSSLAEARYAVNRMAGEMLKVTPEDILSVSSTQIDFIDSSGLSTNFRMADYQGSRALMRGNELLAFPVQDFEIRAITGEDQLSTDPQVILRYEFSLTTQPVGSEPAVRLQSSAMPRSLLYKNYQ